jgi:hypothetical protein
MFMIAALFAATFGSASDTSCEALAVELEASRLGAAALRDLLLFIGRDFGRILVNKGNNLFWDLLLRSNLFQKFLQKGLLLHF